jgi:hypothetical protein
MLVFRLAVATCAWLSAVPSCGLIFGRPAAEEDSSPADTQVSVEVESHNWSDIVIYLVRGTHTQRLGMVTGLSTIHFAFPYQSLSAGSTLRLRAYPIGGPGSHTSENLMLQPGQSIKWTLESDLSRSFLAIY